MHWALNSSPCLVLVWWFAQHCKVSNSLWCYRSNVQQRRRKGQTRSSCEFERQETVRGAREIPQRSAQANTGADSDQNDAVWRNGQMLQEDHGSLRGLSHCVRISCICNSGRQISQICSYTFWVGRKRNPMTFSENFWQMMSVQGTFIMKLRESSRTQSFVIYVSQSHQCINYLQDEWERSRCDLRNGQSEGRSP